MHRALGLDPAATVDARQAQAGQVALVTSDQRGSRINQVDALITNVPSLPLMLRFADCVPILFYDPVNRAIGITHAGWRGTVEKVAANTVRSMGEAFGSDPRDLRACIGPSIGPCCYEIGPDVRERVERAFGKADELMMLKHGSLHLDLWGANARILSELGVGEIEVSGICTFEHTVDFFSWRREKTETGRFAALITLG